MSKQTESNLFIDFSFSDYARLYQLLLKGLATYEGLGRELLSQIKTAHAFRQVEKVKQLSGILVNFPISEYRLIAQYYLVWCRCRESDYQTDVLERVIEQSQTYKAKAIISRAALEVYKGNTEAALYFYVEAFKLPLTISEYIEASRGIALVKTLEGFNRLALNDLESLLPIIRHAEPSMYFDCLNSYAVELTEVGRLQEAENVSRLVIASPFSSYYPEWKATFEDVRRHHKRRSTISIGEPMTLPTPQASTTNVIQFPSGERISSDESISDLPMSALQALAMIIRSVAKGALTETQIEKICDGFKLALELMLSDED